MKINQQDKMQQELAEKYPEVVAEIDNIVIEIANIVRMLPPVQLLNMASKKMMLGHAGIESESEITSVQTNSFRMVEYLQSVVSAVKPECSINAEIAEDIWNKLHDLVDKLFNILGTKYHIYKTAYDRKNNLNYDDDFDGFSCQAQMWWCNVRMQRYHYHQKLYFDDLLSPHTDILLELFNITAETLVNQVIKIQNAFQFGLDDAFNDMRKFIENNIPDMSDHDKTLAHIQIMFDKIKDDGAKERLSEICNRLFDAGLCDLEKITALPKSLLDELSWEPGQDEEFFSDGQFRGWPLRIWPTFKRPFIKINKHYYCFEPISLLDNLYRILQKTICRLKPDYRTAWKEQQTTVSEKLPFKYLETILVGAKTHRNIYYKWYPNKQTEKKEWCEADGLLSYDGYLFIIESRAGAFTYTSPATDFDAYIRSIKSLIWKPYTQGSRFIEYLNSGCTVEIFNDKHEKITQISKKDYRHIVICGITLDHFTELAAQTNHLKNIDGNISAPSIWSISIDDLRVYADVFSNPLTFLHFVKQRIKASDSSTLKLNDELDHLGLYIKHNDYVMYEKEMLTKTNSTQIFFGGYREDIDKFFPEKQLDPNTPCPIKQNLPERLNEVLNYLNNSKKSGRTKISNLFLDYCDEWRHKIANSIDDVLTKQLEQHRICPFSIYAERSLTIFCWQHDVVQRDNIFAIKHVQSDMLIKEDSDRMLLELIYSIEGKLVDAYWNNVNLNELSSNERDQLQFQANQMKQQRTIKAYEQNKKIGRNDPCPCYSGKKFKKCCLTLLTTNNIIK